MTGMRSRKEGTARRLQQAAVGVSYDVRVKVEVNFSCAQDYCVDHGREVSFAVVVVGCEWGRGDVAGIAGDRLNTVEIEGLAVEDVVGESFL